MRFHRVTGGFADVRARVLEAAGERDWMTAEVDGHLWIRTEIPAGVPEAAMVKDLLDQVRQIAGAGGVTLPE